MMKKLHRIGIGLRYIVTLSSLSVMVFMRTRIGQNVYSPWNNLPFGKGSGFYHARPATKITTIVLLYVWVRLFAVMYMLTVPGISVLTPFQTMYTIDIFSGSFQGMGSFFLIYSYVVVIAGFVQLIAAYELTDKEEWPDHISLGDSMVFNHLLKDKDTEDATTDKFYIWSFLDPLLVAAIGVIFFVFVGGAHALFFWVAATCMSYQGYCRLVKDRAEKDYLEERYRTRAATLEQEKRIKKARAQNSKTKIKEDSHAVGFNPVDKEPTPGHEDDILELRIISTPEKDIGKKSNDDDYAVSA